MSRAKTYLKENLVLVIAFAAVSLIEMAVIFPIMCGDYINYDSSYQYGLTQHTIPEIWELLPYDYSPPFYAMALKLYSMIFGSSLLAMRSFSLLALIGMYFISTFPMNTLFGKRSAFYCLILTFTSTNILALSNEIRPTIFAFFFFEAVAVYAGIVFSKGTRYSYIGLTVFSVLAMYTHNVSLVGTFAVYVVLLLSMLVTKKWKKLRNIFISGCICAVLYLPWLKVILSQISNVQEHYWTSIGSFSGVINWVFFDCFRSYVTFIFPETLRSIAIIIFVVALLSHINFKKLKGATTLKGLLHLPTEKSVYTRILFLLLCLILSLGMMELVTNFMRNIRADRYYYIFAMLWIVILSAVLGNFGNKVLCAIFTVLLIANHVTNMVYVKQDVDNANMTEIVEEIHSRNPDGNISFFHLHEYSLGILSYYFPEATHYVCDETYTVLRTYDVFPCEVVEVGSIDNIWDYTDSFYMFKNQWGNADWNMSFLDELERMNNNEVTDIGIYFMPYKSVCDQYELSEAVYISTNTISKSYYRQNEIVE